MRRLGLVLLIVILALSLAPAVFAQGSRGGGVVTGNTVVRSGETISGDLIVAGGNLVEEAGGAINGNVVVFGGNADIGGAVRGDLSVVGGNITLRDSANVTGSVNTIGGNVNRATGARVGGSVGSGAPQGLVPPTPLAGPTGGGSVLGWLLSALAGLVLTVLLGLLAVALLPRPLNRVADAITASPFGTSGLGFLTWLLAPLVIIVMSIVSALLVLVFCIGLLGFGALVILIILFLLGILFGWLATSFIVGRAILSGLRGGRASNPYGAIALGVVILGLVTAVLGLIPCLGGVVSWLLTLPGLGAVILTYFGTRPWPRQPQAAPVSPAPGAGGTAAPGQWTPYGPPGAAAALGPGEAGGGAAAVAGGAALAAGAAVAASEHEAETAPAESDSVWARPSEAEAAEPEAAAPSEGAEDAEGDGKSGLGTAAAVGGVLAAGAAGAYLLTKHDDEGGEAEGAEAGASEAGAEAETPAGEGHPGAAAAVVGGAALAAGAAAAARSDEGEGAEEASADEESVEALGVVVEPGADELSLGATEEGYEPSEGGVGPSLGTAAVVGGAALAAGAAAAARSDEGEGAEEASADEESVEALGVVVEPGADELSLGATEEEYAEIPTVDALTAATQDVTEVAEGEVDVTTVEELEMAQRDDETAGLGATPAVAGGALAAGAAAAHFLKEDDEEAAETSAGDALAAEEAAAAAAPLASAAAAHEVMAPGPDEGLAAEPPPADDLRQLPDVGPVYARLLQARGLTTYGQIAALSWQEVQAVFTGNDPESGYPVIEVSQEGAQAIIDEAARRAQGKND